MLLPRNVCGADHKIRLVLGVALAVVAVRALERDDGKRGTLLWFLAVPVLFTVFTRFCPLNALLGIDTCDGAETKPPGRVETLRTSARP